MTLTEAIKITNRSADDHENPQRIHLVCGFTPLHLETFLKAYGRLRSGGSGISFIAGLYGDLAGNLERAGREASATIVVMEWADLDPRLGVRDLGGWGADLGPDIVTEVSGRLARLEQALIKTAERGSVAISGPTLPLPPVAHTPGTRASSLDIHLSEMVAAFFSRVTGMSGVRAVSRQRLDELSPLQDRFDLKMELFAGFPYKQRHADVFAGLLIDVLYPPAPKKGLITDLDNTLWSGIVGEIGITNVCWDLGRKAQVHGLYQQLVAALADSGVLVGVASKNDAAVAGEALRRTDMLIKEGSLFPVEVNWGPKSASVERILKAWNVGSESVVFVDDSPMELAEVKAAFPQMECLLFPAGDPEAVWKLLWQLRDLFGKDSIREEDRLRSASLRSAAVIGDVGEGEAPADFLAGLNASITIDSRKDTADERAFELINKTNQFNLNGRRLTEADWKSSLQQRASFLVRVSYQDKFGPLGKIAVLTGAMDGGTMYVHSWVMSCRAFSRRIEHHTLDWLFRHSGAKTIGFDYTATDRNMPLQEFFRGVTSDELKPGLMLTESEFREKCAFLPHRVEEMADTAATG